MAKKRKELTVEQLENLTRGHGKKYVSLDEGAALYSIGKNTFGPVSYTHLRAHET